ncbi:hypothetical protein GOP47_0012833 [Adiantum capillus-veneris]|uniref:Uncharacterized protein n=1 Tax=Adiantum capillus-veneris TaxID=13818 RepID=A0A9D4ZG28_ADICA|nr:hypothetical protein GOP47_0012833 [Adiantum capillus-veneris]
MGEKLVNALQRKSARANKICYKKRVDVMDHLRDDHGTECDISLRKGGQPRGMMNRTSSRTNTYEKQSKVRFKDAAYKFERNKSKFLQGREKSLLRKWNAFDESEKLANGSKEAFVEREMANPLGDYMSTKDVRMAAIQKRIDGGFEMNKRNPSGKIRKEEKNVEDKKVEEKVDIEQACTPVCRM